MVGALLLADTVHGAPSLVLRAVAGILLLAFNLRAGHWAERVARSKGIYHPQYFVLGPIGLVMALVTENKTQATGVSPARPDPTRKPLHRE